MANRIVKSRDRLLGGGSMRDEFFRHPLVLLIVGFVFTGVLGSGYSYWRERNDRMTDANARQIEDYRIATRRLIQSIYLLELRSYRLFDTLTHAVTSDEVREKNRDYEQAASDFGTSLFGNIQLVQAVAPYESGNTLATTRAPEELLKRLQKIFINSDQCLHGMYLTWAAQETKKPIPPICSDYNQNVDRNPISRIERVRNCGTDITKALMSAEIDAKSEARQRYDAFVNAFSKSSSCAAP